MGIHTHIYMYISSFYFFISSSMYVCTYACMYVCMYVCMYEFCGWIVCMTWFVNKSYLVCQHNLFKKFFSFHFKCQKLIFNNGYVSL